MPAVSLFWNTNVAVMTCENNFSLEGGCRCLWWMPLLGLAMLCVTLCCTTGLQQPYEHLPNPPAPPILIYVDELDVFVSPKS